MYYCVLERYELLPSAVIGCQGKALITIMGLLPDT